MDLLGCSSAALVLWQDCAEQNQIHPESESEHHTHPSKAGRFLLKQLARTSAVRSATQRQSPLHIPPAPQLADYCAILNTRATASSPPDSTMLPSAFSTRSCTAALWPCSCRTQPAVRRSHTRTTPSTHPVATMGELAHQATRVTACVDSGTKEGGGRQREGDCVGETREKGADLCVRWSWAGVQAAHGVVAVMPFWPAPLAGGAVAFLIQLLMQLLMQPHQDIA